LNAVLDTGINLIDTARAYETRGTEWQTTNKTGVFISSEEMLGRTISAREDIDEPLVLVTKGHAYTPKDMDEQLAASYKALQLRKEADGLYIGKTKILLVYLLHGIKDDRWSGIVESGVLDHAKKKNANGDFTWLGFSSHYDDTDVIKKAIDTGSFRICELPYNVYNPSLGEEGKLDLIKYAHDKGMGVVNMKAFNGNGTKAIFPQISEYSGFGYDEMLRFCLSNPYISTIDAGAVNIKEFNADIEASLLPVLSKQERSELREKAKKLSPFLKSICRECMHCVEKFECPNNIDFPRILGLHGRYTVSEGMGLATDPFRSQYAAFSPSADACIECGQCVTWCEYHLDIPAMMKTAAQDLAADSK
jgi:predicted aldo/keto reductase-like oxidoreductase